MSNEIQKLFKVLLNKEFYENHKFKLPIGAFDEIGQSLFPALQLAHEKCNRDLNEEDISIAYSSLNPVLTTANKNTVEAYLDNIKEIEPFSLDIAELAFKASWRKEIGRQVANYGYEIIEGRKQDLDGLSSFVSKVSSDFVPTDFDNSPVDTDPVLLFERLKEKGKWSLNIPYLKEKVGCLSAGNFITVLARPESGKTAFIVNTIAGKEGFAAQGANVHLLANEEGADATAGRAICCFNEMAFEEARENPNKLKTIEWENIRKNLTFIHQPEMTMAQLDYYCKKHKPDVLVVDQLDHVGMYGDYSRSDERLGAVYRRFRELASIHGFVGIGISQASAEAEGRTKVNFSMAEGSKTSKAATADLVIGIGKQENEEGDSVLRYFTVSKNKISGFKGTVVCKLIQSQSRFLP